MVHQLGYTLSWSVNASAALRETGESVDYGCGVLLCGHKSSITEGILCYSSGSHRKCCKYTWKGVSSNILLRSYSKSIRSEGLQPQLMLCAPFPSIAQYFRKVYVSYLKIQMAIVAYPKVRISIIVLSEMCLDIGWKYID
jgi:hypothetical protein